MNPRLSPDGKYMAVISFDRTTFARHLVTVGIDRDSTKERERELEYSLIDNFSWSPDSKSLTYLSRDGVQNLWKLPLGGGKAEPITDFKTGRIFNFAWSRDGKSIFLVRGVVNNDLVSLKDLNK